MLKHLQCKRAIHNHNKMAVKQNNGYSFTFKKTVVKKLSQPGFNESDSEDDEFTLASKRACFRLQLEDRQMKSKRLKEEGSILAEAGRYWEAVSKWNEAIEINPESAVLYEMKSQVGLLGEPPILKQWVARVYETIVSAPLFMLKLN